jgi:uncharacterized protein (TIGR03085 family)
MSTALDARERVQLCTRFDELGPDAPTLCEGWTTFDLAAHLVVRERNPAAGPGILLGDRFPRLGRATEHAMEKEKRRGYDVVVERVRTGPPLGPFRVPGLRTQINLLEYVVHHEDVRRANDLPTRVDVDDLQVAVGALFKRMARFALRGIPDGVRVDFGTFVMGGGNRNVRVSGDPIELILWAYGRGDHADVRFEGDEADKEAVRAAHLTI